MLPQKTYELIRWLIAIVLPALGLLVINLEDTWNFGVPAQEISLTLDALGLFLGTIFGVSKIVNDSENKKMKKNKK